MDPDELVGRLRTLQDEHQAMAERLSRLEDERELRELLSMYGFTADLGRSREYVDLYTEDGRIDLGAGRFGAGDGAYIGHEKLYEFITGSAHLGIQGYCQHIANVGPLIFHIDGDDAIGEGYSLVVVQSDERERRTRSTMPERAEVNISGANFNRWHFRRVDGRWRIVRRVNRQIGDPNVHDVITNSLKSERPDAERMETA